MCIFATDMRNLLYILVVMGILTACESQRDKAVKTLLDSVSVVMEEYPEMADTLLSSLEDSVTELSTPQRIQYYLLRAEASYKLDKQMPSDTVFQEVVDYYDRHGNANQRMKAYYLMGGIYRYRHEAPMALQWYLDATEQADTLSPDCDNWALMKVYGQMADLYHSQLMPKEEIAAHRQFSKYAEKAGNTYQAIRGIEFQLGAYQLMGDTAMILALTDSVHELYLQADMPQAAASVYPTAIYIYLAKHDYLKTKQLMEIFEHESGLFDAKGNISKGREHYYCAKGAYYKGIHELDSAEYYYRKLLNYHYDYDAYKGLLHLFELRRQSDSIIKYIPYFETAHNAEINHLRFESTQQVQSMYDYERNQKNAYEKEIEAKNKQIVIIALCFLITLTIYVISYLYRKRKRLYLKAVKLIRKEKAAKWKETNLAEKQAIKLRKNKEVIKSLEFKNKELRSQLHPRNNLVAETMLMNSDEVKAVTQYVSMSGFPTGDEWKNLERAFMKYMPNFYALLNSHRLESLEKRICYLTFMGIRPKIIALLLDISPTYLSNIRKGIKEKLEVNTKQSFESIVIQFVKTLRE